MGDRKAEGIPEMSLHLVIISAIGKVFDKASSLSGCANPVPSGSLPEALRCTVTELSAICNFTWVYSK